MDETLRPTVERWTRTPVFLHCWWVAQPNGYPAPVTREVAVAGWDDAGDPVVVDRESGRLVLATDYVANLPDGAKWHYRGLDRVTIDGYVETS